MAARSNHPRRLILDEARSVIAKAARTDRVVFTSHEAKRLAQLHPDCGMTEEEISRELFELAVEKRLAVDPSP